MQSAGQETRTELLRGQTFKPLVHDNSQENLCIKRGFECYVDRINNWCGRQVCLGTEVPNENKLRVEVDLDLD